MNDTWRIVVVLLATALLIEAVCLVAMMRQLGSVLLHLGPMTTEAAVGPGIGQVRAVPGHEEARRPALTVFTSSGCQHCKQLAPGLRRMHSVYGPGAEHGHQLDLIVVVTDEDARRRAEYAQELGSFARTDLSALMQEWDIPGTPFAVAFDAAHRVVESRGVNAPEDLEMLAIQRLGLVGVESEIDGAEIPSLQVGRIDGVNPRRTEVLR